jgi:hypothetical protein
VGPTNTMIDLEKRCIKYVRLTCLYRLTILLFIYTISLIQMKNIDLLKIKIIIKDEENKTN